MKDFKKVAQDATSGSFVMVGREAIKTDLVIAGYPNGITINGADLISTTDTKTGEQKTYAACTFIEDDTKYVNGGTALTNIVREWMDGYESAELMSADLKAAGGVKIKLSKEMTKDGKSFTKVTVV